jgi:Amt family ammonium transporter
LLAAGALAAMFWPGPYIKPDISMTLNGVLAGLVGVTAGCAAVSPVGAFLSDLSVV